MQLLPSRLSCDRRSANLWKLFRGQEEKLKSKQGDLACFRRAKCRLDIQPAHGAQLCPSEVEDNLCFKCLSLPTIATPAPRGFWEAVLLWFQGLPTL